MPSERSPADASDAQQGIGARVAAEHRDLNAILSDVREALRDRSAAPDALERLVEAFDVHFSQEDRLYYPAIGSLRPDLRGRLLSISDGHASFRARLDEIREQLDGGDLAAASLSLDALARDFGAHEAAEEELLAELDRALGAAR